MTLPKRHLTLYLSLSLSIYIYILVFILNSVLFQMCQIIPLYIKDKSKSINYHSKFSLKIRNLTEWK